MTSSQHSPRRPLLLGLGMAVTLAACAQSPTASPAPPQGGTSAPGPATTAPPSRAPAYAGHFESDCQQLGDAFYTHDLVDLAPAEGGHITARYAKAFHDAPGCAPASLIVVFHMPAVQWAFDGTTLVQGRAVDRIRVRPAVAGAQLTASQARAGWLGETPTQFLLKRDGQGKGLPVDKAVEQPPTKELRLLTSQRLYSSPPDGQADTYPTELDLENYLQRKPAP